MAPFIHLVCILKEAQFIVPIPTRPGQLRAIAIDSEHAITHSELSERVWDLFEEDRDEPSI